MIIETHIIMFCRNKKTKLDNVEKEIDLSNKILSTLQTKFIKHKDEMDIEKNKLQSQREEDFVPLSNVFKQLLR